MAWAARLILVALLAAGLAGQGGSASATHLGYKPCSDTTLRGLHLTHVQSNFGCRSARRALRSLLAHGVRGLPKPTAVVGRWGCRDPGTPHFHVCERRRSDQRAAAGVVFAARAQRR
jgi:hypothetical protein